MCFFTVIAGIQAHKKQGVFPVQTYLRQTVYPDTQSTPSQRITVIWIENSLVRRKFQLSKRIFKLTKETGHKERPDW